MAARASDINSVERFSDRVEDYVRYRPSYPAELIRYLSERTGLGDGSVVADVGSGTGIFTRLLLEAGARVFAVEPNDAMRGAAEKEFLNGAKVVSRKGTAEATGLEDGSVSLVTCAQAFHWFDVAGARREFRRILVPDGWCALVWNTSIVDDSAFAAGYEQIKNACGTEFQRVRHEHTETMDRFDALFGRSSWEKHDFPNFQALDLAGLKGRFLSSSYAPKPGHPRHDSIIAALRDLFDRCQQEGLVRMNYTTELILGRLR